MLKEFLLLLKKLKINPCALEEKVSVCEEKGEKLQRLLCAAGKILVNFKKPFIHSWLLGYS